MMCHTLLIAAAFVIESVRAEAVRDSEFKYLVQKRAYSTGGGPTVMIDEAHFNHHTSTGRYRLFAEVLRQNCYVVQSSKAPFGQDSLKRGNILLIANALHKSNDNYWVPPYPCAFTDEEIKAVHDWVNDGCALLLIADHLP